jgi:hypothetical protein
VGPLLGLEPDERWRPQDREQTREEDGSLHGGAHSG